MPFADVRTNLVTGGAGFLGSQLVDALVRRGEFVVVIDNLSTGRLANLDAAISSGKVTFIYSDVAVDTYALRSIVDQSGIEIFDSIFHFASTNSVSVNLDRQTGDFANGALSLSTMSLIEFALERHARLIFASPLRTDDFARETVKNDESLPDGFYQGRLFDEEAMTAAFAERSLNGVVVRICDVYGPRMPIADGSFLADLFDAALNRRPTPFAADWAQLRPYLFVDDAIRQLLSISDCRELTSTVAYVVSTEKVSDHEVVAGLGEIVGMDLTVNRAARKEANSLINKRTTRIRSNSPGQLQTPFREGLRKSYDWFLRDGQLFV